VKPHRRRSFDATDSCALSQVSLYRQWLKRARTWRNWVPGSEEIVCNHSGVPSVTNTNVTDTSLNIGLEAGI